MLHRHFCRCGDQFGCNIAHPPGPLTDPPTCSRCSGEIERKEGRMLSQYGHEIEKIPDPPEHMQRSIPPREEPK